MRGLDIVLIARALVAPACGDDEPQSTGTQLVAWDVARVPSNRVVQGHHRRRPRRVGVRRRAGVEDIGPAPMHDALNALLEARNRVEVPVGDEERKVELSIVNSLWGLAARRPR
ncbi:MAG: hypothetical protein WEE36_11465 [Acidimicrobiia bacterium]